MTEAKHIHFLGIGGIGMSGLALLLAGKGHRVSGCDLGVPRSIARWLAAAGVRLQAGHSPRHLCGRAPDLLVRTPAVPEDNPELAAARRRGITVATRGKALADYANAERTVAVCGTHGKTTTSCLTAALLKSLPSPHSSFVTRRSSFDGVAGVGWCIGGWTESLGRVARAPAPGAPFVIEADESDGTLALYRPAVTVLTSIEQDHLEHFDSFEALAACFRAVCRQTREAVVYCADDPVCREVVASVPGAIGYGFGEGATLRASNLRLDGDELLFDLSFGGEHAEGLRLPIPGRHNVLNALGAIGAALALGHPFGEILPRLGALRELPHRRYERIRCRAGFEIVTDYSHHPTEIRALLEMAKARGRPLFAVFQPHRYTRTKALLDQFPGAFAPLSADGPTPDRLVLLPVYPAFESPLEGGTTADLYARLRAENLASGRGVVPELASSVDEVLGYLRARKSLPEQYDIVVIGAGDVGALAERLRTAAKFRDAAPAPFRVSLGVPAFADELIDVADEAALAEVLRRRGNARPVRVLGQGTNLLPPPLGVRGAVLRLRNEGVAVREEAGGFLVSVGCGTPGAKLLAELARRGISGLEFMAGIPGTVGGWLAMNAGTRHGEIGDAVVGVTAFTPAGRLVTADRRRCGFGYRSCRFLEGKVAFGATFRLRRGDPDGILSAMRGFLEKRFDFGGLRTAGSAFANPPGGFAGALLEKAGCKGLRVGGAYVSERHANIVAADPGATASDVLALLEIMHGRVLRQCGVNLKQEIKTW